jgi:hypothetical protein
VAAKKPHARKTQRSPRLSEDRPEHRFTVILEDVNSKLTALAEGLTMTRESLERRMDGLDGRMDRLEGRMDRLEGRMDGLDGRMDTLEARVDAGFAEHGARIGRLESAVLAHSGEIRNLATLVGAVESKLDAKADASRVEVLEARAVSHDR